MCGELDDDIQINAEVRDRLFAVARRVGVKSSGARDVGPLAEAAERAAYMEGLFRDALGATLSDVDGAAEDQRIDVIASRAIAFARLAGFLAGHLPPEADLFRSLVEALTEGHAEPRRIGERLRAELDHHHHHHHADDDHDHHHHDGHAHTHTHG
jgi:hypothetical protein